MKHRPDSNRLFVEDCHSIDILDLPADDTANLIAPTVTIETKWLDGTAHRTIVHLTKTRPFFGGVRWWYECPSCGRRARKLLIMDKDRRPTCRQCKGVVYRSQWRC